MRLRYILFLLLFFSSLTKAQTNHANNPRPASPSAPLLLHIDTSMSPVELVKKLLVGQGMYVGKVTYTGHPLAIARYKADAGLPLELKEGIILSTGNVFDAIGPNDYPYMTTAFSNPATLKRYKGDKDLNRVAHNLSYDVAVLEFDFVPFDNKVSFEYCFGSEEYPEYVDSRYNDVFGFFLKGPKYNNKNLATLPLSVTPVTINSINYKLNKQVFVDNDFFTNAKPIKVLKTMTTKSGQKKEVSEVQLNFKINVRKQKKINPALWQNLQYDGFTKVLTAWCYVQPYQVYHIKIAIGDIGDNSYDSGVFLSAGTFSSKKDTKMPRFKEYADLHAKINFDSLMYGGWPPKPKVLTQEERKDSIDEAEAASFQITNVNFESDSYVVPDTSRTRLTELAQYIKRNPFYTIELYGYTDNQGNKEYNQKLSEHRSQAVMNLMIAQGALQKNFRIAGFNFERPLGDNTNDQGRARNRRVEIILVDNRNR